MHKLFLFVIIFCTGSLFAGDVDDAAEYDALWEDLLWTNTAGYKTIFNAADGKAAQRPQWEQGSPQTGGIIDSTILGKGFFKIRLGDGRAGWTRNGAFSVSEGDENKMCELKITTRHKHYSLTKIFSGLVLIAMAKYR